MKIQEDSEDLNQKWKGQVQSKDNQIKILNEQNNQLQDDIDKMRKKLQATQSVQVDLESQVQQLESKNKQQKVMLESVEDEMQGIQTKYNKMFAQFN
jgi:chromosome segregation ATPase